MRQNASSTQKEKEKLRKGLWSPEEDEKLYNHIVRFGIGCWSIVPKQAGLQRCGKSCRLRWINYLRPDLKRGNFSELEEDIIIKLHEILGNRWSQIASQLPGRTDNEIKNYWNSNLKKKLKRLGIDPNTHKPLSDTNRDATSSFKPSFDPFPVGLELESDTSRSVENATNNIFYNHFQESVNADIDSFLVPNNLEFFDNYDNVVTFSDDPSNCSNLSNNNVTENDGFFRSISSSTDDALFDADFFF